MSPPALLVDDSAAARALVAALADAPVEVAETVYLDPKWRILLRHRFAGGADMIRLPARQLVQRGLEVDARYVILAHNHPSGDPEPSAADIVVTRRLSDALRLIDMPLADHLIVARGGIVSMRERGLL